MSVALVFPYLDIAEQRKDYDIANVISGIVRSNPDSKLEPANKVEVYTSTTGETFAGDPFDDNVGDLLDVSHN